MSERLHIAHVLRKYDAAELGGTETHVAEMTRRLLARGITGEVHAPRGPREDEESGLAVPLVRYRAICPFLGSAAQRRALRANAGNLIAPGEPLRLLLDEEISLAHLHTAGRIGGGVRVAMRLSRRPYVVSVHGPMLSGDAFLAADLARRTRGTLDLGKPFGMLVGARRVLDDAARVICFNRAEERALRARVGERARRMDHGVDLARFSRGDAARARQRWPQLGAGGLVVQVGRLCDQKDQLLSLRAFAAGAPRDAQLVLAGAETDAGYRARLEAEAAALGVAARVVFLGNLPAEQVPDLLALATLCLAPSQHEAFGLLVLEAWAAGKPVLFSREGGLDDLALSLAESESGACASDGAASAGPRAIPAALATRDVKPWGEAMAALLASAELRARAAGAGRKLLARFDWERAADGLAALYREVVAESRRGAA